MARSKQTIKGKSVTVIKTNKNTTKTRTTKKSSGGKRGNPNRCPTCGRFM